MPVLRSRLVYEVLNVDPLSFLNLKVVGRPTF